MGLVHSDLPRREAVIGWQVEGAALSLRHIVIGDLRIDHAVHIAGVWTVAVRFRPGDAFTGDVVDPHDGNFFIDGQIEHWPRCRTY